MNIWAEDFTYYSIRKSVTYFMNYFTYSCMHCYPCKYYASCAYGGFI